MFQIIIQIMKSFKEVCEEYQSKYGFDKESKDEVEQNPYNGKGKSRAWFMTLNNPTVDDMTAIEIDDMQWKQGQFEKGKTGTPHLQMVFGYASPRVKPVKKHGRAWMRPMKSMAALDYVTKQDTAITEAFSEGKMPEQGARNDLEEVAGAIKNGMKMDEIASTYPSMFVKFHRGLKELRISGMTHRTQPPEVYWLWGQTGVGKSRWAIDTFGEENVYIKDNTQWWDGYDQQICTMIDDFGGNWEFRDLLRVLDRYRYNAQVKGGYCKLNSPFIVITCEYPPNCFWAETQLAQMMRRITEVCEIVIVNAQVKGYPAGPIGVNNTSWAGWGATGASRSNQSEK